MIVNFIDLFQSKEEAELFCNIKARLRTNKEKQKMAEYNEEIEEALNILGNIISENGGVINYQKELYDLDRLIESETDAIKLEELNARRAELSSEYSEFVSGVYHKNIETAENMYFQSKKIDDRLRRIKTSTDICAELQREYPGSIEVDVRLASTIPVIKRIWEDQRGYTDYESAQDVVEFPKEEKSEESYFDEIPEKVQSDTSFFTSDSSDGLSENITNKGVTTVGYEFEEVAPEQTSSIDYAESSETAQAETTKLEEKSDNADEYVEIVSLFNEEAPEVKQEDEEVFRYTMDGEQSLEDIATAMYDGHPDAWTVIYEANRGAIEARLAEKGLTREYAFEKDAKVLEGLDLVIPNTYTKVEENEFPIIEETPVKSLAA